MNKGKKYFLKLFLPVLFSASGNQWAIRTLTQGTNIPLKY